MVLGIMGLNYNGWTKEKLIAFEKDIEEHFLNGEIRAPVHFSAGNEDQLIRIFQKVRNSDWVFSTHRNHYHALLHGIPADWLKEQIMLGRSMHINSREHKFMTSSIVGGCAPIALGVAAELKERGSTDRVWCFLGEMAASVGAFKDCLAYARNFRLPICYVIECNGLSTNSPTYEIWGREHRHDFNVRCLHQWGNGCVYTYCYLRGCSHINVQGKWVIFK